MFEKLYEFLSGSSAGLAFSFAIALVIMICCAKLVDYVGNTLLPNRVQKSVGREKCAGIILSKLGDYMKAKKCRTFKNVELAENTKADLVLVGPFGVMAFIGCNIEGQLYPVDEESEKMIGYYNGKKMKFDNPMVERGRAEKALNELIRGADVKRCRCDALTVFTNKRADIVAPESLKFVTCKDLAGFVKRNKFFEDHEVNVDEIAALFEGKEVK